MDRPTYEELEQRVTYLESELTKNKEGIQEYLQRFVDRSQEIIYRYDIPSRSYVLYNKAGYELHGLKDGKTPSPKSVLLSIHPEDRDRVKRAGLDSLAPGYTSGEVEFRQMHADGSVHWMYDKWIVIRDAADKAIAIEGIVRDETDRKRAEKALLESEEKYRRLFEMESDAIFLIRKKDGQILEVNTAGTKLYGFSREELLKMKNTDLSSEPDATQEATMEQKREISVRYHRKNDGTIFPVEITASHFIWQGEEVHIATIRDITFRIEAEKEKIKLEARLRQTQKMEAIGALAGGIAHDFNNILSPIIINTELALMDIPEGSTLILNLNEVLKASKRAKDLVMQILTFSRQTAQERVPLNLSSIVKEATKLLRSSIPATIEIRQNILTKSDTILADSTQLHQVLMNLGTNAYHAMREKGGVLEVSLSDVYHDEDSAMNIDSFKPGPYLRLAVKDTGTGINPGIVDKIFEPYLTTKEKGVGTGLGLAVVDGIVKNHGGSIQVESAQGEGATFKVFFPKIDLTAIEKIDTREPMPTGNERILFVDDEAVIANVGKQMLERLGYDVITRTGSIDALEHFRSQPDLFDLVITDVTMPNMTGVELSKEIMSIRPDIPVILSTGFSEKIDEKKALELGVRAFLMKPVVMSEMANTIRKVLDEK